MSKFRVFNEKWTSEFKWLDYRDGKMFCEICCKARMKNVFTSGCSNFQHSTLLRHIDANSKDGASGQHFRALQIVKQQISFKATSENQIKKSFINEENQLRTVYWMAKEQVAEIKYSSLIELQKANGAQFPNGTYSHRSVVVEMTNALADAVQENIEDQIAKSPFIGVICDESCDVANFKKLIVYFTFIHESGCAKTAFVDIVDIDDGCADTILDAIKSTLNTFSIDLHYVVGLGTDGAPVMTGCKGGVGVKLKESGAIYLSQIHCAAHRVSLALSQAAKTVTPVHNIEILLAQLFHFFDDSPVRESVLRQIQEINNSDAVKLKEPKQIRWLSLYEAVDAILKTYPSVIQTLEHIAEKRNDINSAKAKGLLSKVKNFSFPYLLSVILDVTEPIKKLSSMFQNKNVLFSKVCPMVKSCIDTIIHLKHAQGENEKIFNSNCIVDDDDEMKFNYQGVELGEKISKNNIKLEFINAVVENLQYRFPQETLDVLKSLNAVLNPKAYPSSKSDLNSYGERELDVLVEKYGTGISPLIDRDIISKNFKHFKQLTHNFCSHNMQDYIKILVNEYKEEFPHFVKLAQISLALPISSADAERGFSCMKRIKTNLRNAIGEKKLKNLMLLAMEGPPVAESKDIVMKANKIFNEAKKRTGGTN